ncbi:MAG: carboxylesterase family protein, partial [Chloroflexota bacterium]
MTKQSAQSKTPTVTITSGQLSGTWTGSKKDQPQIAIFNGIPYAAPPVGELRWRPPQPVEPWTKIRKATATGPSAWQRAGDVDVFLTGLIEGQGWGRLRTALVKRLATLASPKQDEDCLYLNVYTPTLDNKAKLPVMVWIHGGDHQDGSGSDPIYTSTTLAKQGIVYVSINYRLGLLGYFAHPELTAESEQEIGHSVSGNYGTLDQIAALKWVRSNIAAFGGDPDNVTIFGESAGGESVAHMMTSPLAEGLFHRAIMQSPANAGQMIHLSRRFLDHLSGEEIGLEFAAQLGLDQLMVQKLKLMLPVSWPHVLEEFQVRKLVLFCLCLVLLLQVAETFKIKTANPHLIKLF